ncbi:hypothetical protein K8I78_21690 [Salmonella enterica subsp. arizonae]|nr:hypothetical protein K8I78_21690 [Salmonella enterica subsp. arizonae]
MTTITREQQKQILIDTANHVISRDNTSPYSENLRELARIALASLEAEPVAWECGENIILFNPDTVEAYAKRAEISPKPLYDSPPVPAVPEECPADISVLMASHSDALFNDDDAQEIWNACRAAMLQGGFRDLSQPVDPQVAEYEQIMLQAGWVMVPVEPTEEMIAAAMECEDVLFNSDGSFCVQFREIYCAMVTAAPKPEGNSK